MRNRLPCFVVGGIECGCSVVVCLKVEVRISRGFCKCECELDVGVEVCFGMVMELRSV
jgi:hypothetical protein